MNKALVVGITSAVSLGVGSVAGYLFAKKRLEKQFSEIADETIAEGIAQARRFYKKNEFKSPAANTAEIRIPVVEDPEEVEEIDIFDAFAITEPQVQAVPEDPEPVYPKRVFPQRIPGAHLRDSTGNLPQYVDYNGVAYARKDIPPPSVDSTLYASAASTYQSESPDPVKVQRNIFRDGQPHHGLDEDAPYVISHDAFMANDPEHSQATLTYYAGDNILADENEEDMVDIFETAVGKGTLRFGEESNDPDVVYIRNNELQSDYEVIRRSTKYADDILGADEKINDNYGGIQRHRR